ncbi:DUF4837 family protein [Croceivirga sp. JEA036]|uniref:DUF4837 family protein n=1 Tax=Croceivirga sp. JEA036 TaxID=2721162 RepID=UPI00143AF4FE|nr:DUF4837 family protein [Croceivirga sp. JEA036]NJB37061.1 DUF4837 family protein [Croceivirga sp. JEA036]
MKKLGTLLMLGIIFLAAFSCNEKSEKKASFLPPSTGSVNSLMVVIDTELWQGEIGDKIRELFAAPAPTYMPEQPILTLTQLPPQVFKGTALHARSVLFVAADSTAKAHIKTDIYATPQKLAVVKGAKKSELLKGLEDIAQEAITAFRNTDISETQKRFKRSLSKEKALENTFGVSLTLPSVYRLGKEEANFVWFDRQIPKGNMNIIAYALPADIFSVDSTFVRDIVRVRDSIVKENIPGEYEGTYMMTEKAFAPFVYPAEIGGKKAAEVRGIWEIHGYPMAGPFLSYIINDKENNRKLVLEGFTFAPNTQKRDYMFELEAVLKTLRFDVEDK